MATNKVLHIQPITLNKRIKSGDDICLVDVREDWEYSLTSIKGSTHIPLNELADRVQEIMFEEEIAVYCHPRGEGVLGGTGFDRFRI